MKKHILMRFVESGDLGQLGIDLTDASRELTYFMHSFDPSDIPVAVFLMQNAARHMLETFPELSDSVAAIDEMIGSAMLVLPEKYHDNSGGNQK